jgi:hypothetical protein
MAIVANKAVVAALDRPYTSPNRTTAADPNGALTPQYAGEIVADTTNKKWWMAGGLANNTWITYDPSPRA